jgi:hypothetical protein
MILEQQKYYKGMKPFFPLKFVFYEFRSFTLAGLALESTWPTPATTSSTTTATGQSTSNLSGG